MGEAAQPLSFQAFVLLVLWPYYWTVNRIRAWGDLPKQRGPTLCIANHQHDLDDKATLSYLSRRDSPDRTIYVVSGRRLFERGALAWVIPWLEPAMRGVDASPLFYGIGMLPIENEIRSRAFIGLARAVYDRHGDLPLAQVFRPEALRALGTDAEGARLSYAFGPKAFQQSRRTELPLKYLLEPYRGELFETMHLEMESDLKALETRLENGATFWLAPEGRHSKTGQLGPLRTALRRLAPHASSIYTIAISYDIFVGRRLSMLFRVVPAIDRDDLPNSMKAARPVTVSQLLADYFCSSASSKRADTLVERVGASKELATTFTEADVIDAVRTRLAALPQLAWVEPELRRSPERMTRAALAGLRRLGVAARTPEGFALTQKRTDPRFPDAEDIIAHQAAFFEESQSAWTALVASAYTDVEPKL